MKTVQDGKFDHSQFMLPLGYTGEVEPVTVDKPWGEEIWFIVTEFFTFKHLVLDSGKEFSLQTHRVKNEAWVVLQGTLRLLVGPSPDELTELTLTPDSQAFHISHGSAHRAKAIGHEPVIIAEVSTSQLDDVIRHEDHWGRGTLT